MLDDHLPFHTARFEEVSDVAGRPRKERKVGDVFTKYAMAQVQLNTSAEFFIAVWTEGVLEVG